MNERSAVEALDVPLPRVLDPSLPYFCYREAMSRAAGSEQQVFGEQFSMRLLQGEWSELSVINSERIDTSINPANYCLVLGDDLTAMSVAREVKGMRDAAHTILSIPERPEQIPAPDNAAEFWAQHVLAVYKQVEAEYIISGMHPRAAALAITRKGLGLRDIFEEFEQTTHAPLPLERMWEVARSDHGRYERPLVDQRQLF